MPVHKFEDLEPEITRDLAEVHILRPTTAVMVAKQLLQDKDVYLVAAQKTGIPAAWIMAVNERESGGRLDRYLGNGERLDRITRLVPQGRGPWPDWQSGAIDALDLKNLDSVPSWTMARACFEWERWNGFGYRDWHKIRSPYVWAGTNKQQAGKYVQDGKFDPDAYDHQLGALSVALAIAQIDPSLTIGSMPTASSAPVDQPPDSPVG